jgi:tetratricopeptide (TPR) repeat protein
MNQIVWLFSRVFLLLLLIGSSTTIVLTQALSAEALTTEQHLAAFRLSEAKSSLEALNSQGGYRAFYEANIQAYEFFRTLDPANIQTFRGEWDRWESRLESLTDNDPLKYVMLSELHCKRAIMEFLDRNYLTAVRYARTGRVYVKRNQKNFPDNAEQFKILGIFNIALGAVPSKYHWITNTLGFRGDLMVGIQQLTQAAEKGKLLPLESELLLCIVRKNMLDQPDAALLRIEQLRKTRGPNMLLDYMQANIFIDIKRNEEALSIFKEGEEWYQNSAVSYLVFWDYQLAKSYYFKNDLRNAQRYYARFLQGYQGTFMRKDANFRLGMSLTLNGSYSLGKRFFANVAEASDSDFDEDEYAQFMAKKFTEAPPSPAMMELFRARNFFDGGYYVQAVAALDALRKLPGELSPGEIAESQYRYGRIYHSLGRLTEAATYYQQCAAQPVEDERVWLQAYAWFFQGTIAREQRTPALAKQHFEKALTFNKYFYQAGLENRCKAALSEMKEEE